MDIILASSSPRRHELMKLLNVSFKIITQEVEEYIDNSLSPEENVQQLAMKKAMAVACRQPEDIVIGCDTIVVLEDQILGKPLDATDAETTLIKLSGRIHRVCTGVAIICKLKNIETSFAETTYVKMDVLTRKEVADYIATGEPMDKAGSYGIQGRGAVFIAGIEGDYYNVMGLPIHRIYKEFINLNILNTKNKFSE